MAYTYPRPAEIDLSGYVRTADLVDYLKKGDLPAQRIIRTSGPPPDGDWFLALDVRDDWTVKKQTTRLWGQIQTGVAKPLLVLEDALTLPTHADAIAQPDGSFKTDISDLKLTYRNTLNNQNEAEMTLSWPAGSVTRIDFEAQDATGAALETGGQAIAPTIATLVLNPSASNSLVTQILWKITMNGSVVEYRVPLVR